ncbi:MAG: NAD-dependent malic enzyme [Euryarchaeota archaeon HGW-Euryarchaeota-1]|nr:MAG: NAD-dependent malic enzyme [Euryarchaeota archaeon HGW-Euryarchaeota-1]
MQKISTEEILKANSVQKINLKGVPIKNKRDLSVFYTPGVAEVCKQIVKNPEDVYKYTSKQNLVAIVTDGTRILGLGKIGPFAGMPVMEGKAVLFKKFADITAIPICLATKNKDEIIKTIKAIAPSFGAINLEDIESPKCLEIEKKLSETLYIPLFHDDQWGTAIITLAGLINALKVVKKDKNVKICINGCGAAGVGITKLLLDYGFKTIVVADSSGVIYDGMPNLNPFKQEIAERTNQNKEKGNTIKTALVGADVFIGVSGVANSITSNDVKKMNKNAIVFALTNPQADISFEDVKTCENVAIYASGRSDLPNQINNVVVFPGFMKFLLKNRIKTITPEMRILASETIAKYIKNPRKNKIVPSAFSDVAKQLTEMKITITNNN